MASKPAQQQFFAKSIAWLNRYGSAVRAQIANLQRERLVRSGSRDENDDHSDDSEDEWDDLNVEL